MTTRKRHLLVILVCVVILGVPLLGFIWPAVDAYLWNEDWAFGLATGWLACLAWHKHRHQP